MCGLRFCEKCIRLRCVSFLRGVFFVTVDGWFFFFFGGRYVDIAFDAYAGVFKCPRCMDICNCTACCSKRGETYVSSRGVKIDIPISQLYADVPLPRPGRASLSTAAAAAPFTEQPLLVLFPSLLGRARRWWMIRRAALERWTGLAIAI